MSYKLWNGPSIAVKSTDDVSMQAALDLADEVIGQVKVVEGLAERFDIALNR
jgi:hypothetical protein